MKNFLDLFGGGAKHPLDWEKINVEDIPIQNQSNNRAIFMLAYEEYLQKGWNLNFSQKNITKKCGEVVAACLQELYSI